MQCGALTRFYIGLVVGRGEERRDGWKARVDGGGLSDGVMARPRPSAAAASCLSGPVS